MEWKERTHCESSSEAMDGLSLKKRGDTRQHGLQKIVQKHDFPSTAKD